MDDQQTHCPTCDRPLPVNHQCNSKECIEKRHAKRKHQPIMKSAASSRPRFKRNGTPPSFPRADKPRTDPPPTNE